MGISPANNSTINSELTRGGMAGDEVFKVRKFCSLIVTEWAGFSANVRSGESTVQGLEGICASRAMI